MCTFWGKIKSNQQAYQHFRKTDSYYFVSDGLKAGDKIVYTGLGMLKDGAVVNPKALSSDSLLQAKPL